jgi:hypothetical protein
MGLESKILSKKKEQISLLLLIFLIIIELIKCFEHSDKVNHTV